MPGPNDAVARPDHVADMVLRGPTRRLRARVRWPLAGPAVAAPALVVLLHHEGAFVTGVDPLEAALSLVLGVVVLTASVQSTAEAVSAVEWAADHAAELGADPDQLVVAGDGPAAAVAVTVVDRAVTAGWPPIARLLLVRPEGEPAPAPAVRPGHQPPTLVVAATADDPFVRQLRDHGHEVTVGALELAR